MTHYIKDSNGNSIEIGPGSLTKEKVLIHTPTTVSLDKEKSLALVRQILNMLDGEYFLLEGGPTTAVREDQQGDGQDMLECGDGLVYTSSLTSRDPEVLLKRAKNNVALYQRLTKLRIDEAKKQEKERFVAELKRKRKNIVDSLELGGWDGLSPDIKEAVDDLIAMV